MTVPTEPQRWANSVVAGTQLPSAVVKPLTEGSRTPPLQHPDEAGAPCVGTGVSEGSVVGRYASQAARVSNVASSAETLRAVRTVRTDYSAPVIETEVVSPAIERETICATSSTSMSVVRVFAPSSSITMQ